MLHIHRATDLLVAVCTHKELADYRLHSANDILANDDALTSGYSALPIAGPTRGAGTLSVLQKNRRYAGINRASLSL